MDIEKAKQEFIKYTNKYDINNSAIKERMEHSLRVMEISKEIAENLHLTQEQIQLATLIGLLHDTGRFEQYTKYKTFRDAISVDHGDLGVEILKQNNFIRKFIEEEKYDTLILKAIKNHNKFKIEEGLTEEELIFAKIIRDADKIDIFYEALEFPRETEEDRKNTAKLTISDEVFNEYSKKILIDRAKQQNSLEAQIGFISFLFDINYNYSYKILKEKNYIEKILDRYNFENNIKAKEQMKKVREIAKQYIESKI